MTWLQLANRTAIVTGAGSGIGATVAIALAYEGCNVVMADIQNEQSLNIIRSFAPSTKNILTVPNTDVTNPNHVKQLIQQADEFAAAAAQTMYNQQPQQQHNHRHNHFLRPIIYNNYASMLVNCAGITRDSWISKLTLDDHWNPVMDTNLKGTFLTCQAFVHRDRMNPIIEQQRRQQQQQQNEMNNHNNNINSQSKNDKTSSSSRAIPYSILHPTSSSFSIVNIGSIVSELGNIGQVNYAASKGGVLGLTRALAKEVLYQKQAERSNNNDNYNNNNNNATSTTNTNNSNTAIPIRVNAVLPGFIDTPMAQAVPDDIKRQIQSTKIPMQRFGTTQEVSDLVLFLLSPRSNYITGQTIRIDGMISL